MIRASLLSIVLLAIAGPAAAQSMRSGAGESSAMSGFGVAVAVSGEQVLVAEPNDVRAAGTVYVYEKNGASWTEVARLTSEEAARGDLFGASIAV